MESPWRASRCSAGGAIVRPQPETEQSYMDSVFTFIQDVVPQQAYAGSPVTDEKERVVWVRFEKADLNDVSRNPELWEGGGGASTPPLLLMLGYNTGMHIWGLPVSGEAQELYSVRSGPVRCARLLPTPHSGVDRKDLFADKRPLLATCDGASSTGSQPYCGVEVRSLRTGEVVKSIQFKTPIFNLHANHRVLVVALQEKLAAFDSRTLVKTFFITSCYPSPGPNPNPLALGSRWLAYADTKVGARYLVQRHQTYGGVSGDAVQSYTATVISAAKTIRSGLSLFGEAVGRLAGGVRGTGMGPGGCEEDGGPPPTPRRHAHLPGIVTIIDTECVRHGQVEVCEEGEGDGVVAHFPAHDGTPISAMTFDPSGLLLVTADAQGHDFHVFRVMAHPLVSAQAAVHHLYTLHRGDTDAQVQDLSVSDDGRWVCACTLRGTCHVFAVCPYGGVSCVRTHTTPRVANRLSRFHKSAGLDEMGPISLQLHQVQQMQLQHGAGGSGAGGAGGAGAGVGAGSPAPSPGASPHHGKLSRQEVLSSRSSFSYGNPRLPPFPHPGVTIPLAQVKQPLTLGSLTTGPGLFATGCLAITPPCKGAPRTSPQPTGGVREVCVSACFAPSHSPFNTAAHTREKEAHAVAGSLFVLCSVGSLVEHTLEPHPAVGVTRICDDTPLELSCTPNANWGIARSTHWAELRPPFHTTHPLMLAADAVQDALTLPSGVCARAGRGSSESLTSEPEDEEDDEWLSQVEIVTHSGPHRRLWMGPQFTFKTLQLPPGQTMLVSSNSSALLSHTAPESAHATHAAHAPHSDTLDVCSLRLQPVRSDPVCMPARASTLEIEAGSGMFELEVCGSWPDAQHRAWVCDPGDEALRERIADAMMESPGGNMHTTRELQREGSIETLSNSSGSTSGSLPRRYDSSLPTL
ncbi:BCAS3 microtubule associated cell migration factor isoform X1 [Lampetra fluviatilis]